MLQNSAQLKKKKVLILSLAYYPKHVGGAEVAIKEITDRIDPSVIEFHMVTLRFDASLPEVEQVGNVLVHRIGFVKQNPSPEDLRSFPLHWNKYMFQFSAFMKAHTLYAQYHYDGLWGMMAHSTAVPLALFNFFHRRVPFVLTLQEGDELETIEKKARSVWFLFARAFTKARVVQVISSYLGKWAMRMGATCPVVHIPNGVDLDHFTAEMKKSERAVMRRHINKQQEDILLISTSRLVEKNGIDVCISALEHLPSNMHLVLVGTGPLEGALRMQVEIKKLQDRVVFAGEAQYKDIPRYLAMCDIFVRPSRSEGMGNSFIEAMAMELPVVGTQEGGLRDIIFDKTRNPKVPSTGWAVPKDDPVALAQAVEDIIFHKSKREETVENARRLITGTYEWKVIAERMKKEVFARI